MRPKQLSADRRDAADATAVASETGGLTLVVCGALAREILVITDQFPAGMVDLTCLPASWHNHPEKIVPGLARKIRALRRKGRRIAVIYGDCGTGGALDAFLESENIDRIPGAHCYEMFMGKPDFESEMEAQLGTFFLTDYTVRHFERIDMQGWAFASTRSCATGISVTTPAFSISRRLTIRHCSSRRAAQPMRWALPMNIVLPDWGCFRRLLLTRLPVGRAHRLRGKDGTVDYIILAGYPGAGHC